MNMTEQYINIIAQTDKKTREAMVDELSGPEAREFVKRLLSAMHRMGNLKTDK